MCSCCGNSSKKETIQPIQPAGCDQEKNQDQPQGAEQKKDKQD